MADNLNITQGTGTIIATDDVTDSGGAHYQKIKLADGTANSTTMISAGNGTNGGALRVTIASDSTGQVALAAGTNGIGKLTANSGVDIGDVDVTSCALPTGAATSAKQDTGNTSLSSIDGKITACNTGAVAGTVTANAGTNLNTSALALESGGNLAGAATSLAVMDDWDDTDACKVRVQTRATRVQGKVDNADTTTAREVLAAITSNYVYITSFIISVAAAGNYWLEDGDAAQITPKFYLAANGGVSWTAVGDTPYKTTTVNKAINVKGSTAGAVGVMLTGYSATS